MTGPHRIVKESLALLPASLQSACTASSALRSLDKRQGRKQRAMSQESFSSGLGWILIFYITDPCGFQVVLEVKNPPASAGDVRDAAAIPGSGRSPGGGHGNPLQYSWLENPMDTGACLAPVHRIAKSQTGLRRLSMQGNRQLPTCVLRNNVA